MIPCLASILPLLEHLYKSRVPSCTRCGHSAGCTKWCWYRRYDPHTGYLIRIQRYLCPNKKCKAKTFSITPFGFLPYLRISLGALWIMFAVAKSLSVNALSKTFECSRSTIRRRMDWGARFVTWLEANLIVIRDIFWSAFCGLLFTRFYPRRWPA